MIITLEHDISPVVERILKEQWKAKENEKILIITDNPSKEDFSSMSYELMSTMLERNLLAKIFQTIAKKLGYKETELYFIKPTYAHYKDPEDQALEKMVSTADIIFSLTEFSLTDVPTIKKYLDEKKLRHCSAPLILSDIFIEEGPLDINIEEMKQTTLQLHNILKNSKKIVLSDIAHSNLTIVNNSVMWMCEDGILDTPGQDTNLPAGEVLLELPNDMKECLISGHINFFPGWHQSMNKALTLEFKDNVLIKIEGGGELGEKMKDLIQKTKIRIVQFGIGTNRNAKDPLCPTVADKISGMAHISLSPRDQLAHFYFPIAKIVVDDVEYKRSDLFGEFY